MVSTGSTKISDFPCDPGCPKARLSGTKMSRCNDRLGKLTTSVYLHERVVYEHFYLRGAPTNMMLAAA